MKKLILTVCGAALFCIGSIAQVQDSTNLRQGAQDQMDSSSTPNPNAMDMGATAQPPMQDIEVLEDKEGPDHQVIYKYQGGLYYVDREQQQLIKIEESQLKDAEHKAIEHNTLSGNEQDMKQQDKQ
jgi:glucose dehydrogenase